EADAMSACLPLWVRRRSVQSGWQVDSDPIGIRSLPDLKAFPMAGSRLVLRIGLDQRTQDFQCAARRRIGIVEERVELDRQPAVVTGPADRRHHCRKI